MTALVPAAAHLDETALQLLADGTLRGPEGMSARVHCDSCSACASELRALEQMVGTLASLRDPIAPPDFTFQVLAAVDVRQVQLAGRRHIKLAAIPAGLIASIAVLGWAFSEGLVQRLHDVRSSLTAARTTLDVLGPVVEAARLPLGLCAFGLACAIAFVLARTLRTDPRRPQAALEA